MVKNVLFNSMISKADLYHLIKVLLKHFLEKYVKKKKNVDMNIYK